ncbi:MULTISPECIES: L-seryl-tRNA selenium transferase [Campylobacter]|uniref:L-seryl-tRNA selenium transferase n=1 Tax=Campylobacter TaxID=194 RepID=UPI000A359631|nr:MULTISPECIES: L-seryl-tRNA selenium transferase [unclassified Campylobacter]MCR8696897.1 L-seryl-tRNA selenium transferase [Campylobacter sp. RM19073]
MNLKNYILSSLIILTLAGCYTKRGYYEPEFVSKNVSFDGSLSSSLQQTSKYGAVLKNGNILLKNGNIIELNLDKNDNFLGEYQGKLLISSIDGNFKVLMGEDEYYTTKFKTRIVSASINDNHLAALSVDNTIYLIDMISDKLLLEYNVGVAYAIDAKMANPVFLNSIIVYPTLDGKIMIVDKFNGRILRDAVVSSESFFNNIIFLDLLGDKMFAASATKLMAISTQGVKHYDGQIKDVLIYSGKIYLFLKDGMVEILDLELNKLSSKNFKFAIFSGVIPKDDKLYIIEKTGYMFITDLNLNNLEIVKLDSEISKKSFMGENAFYYDDEILELK